MGRRRFFKLLFFQILLIKFCVCELTDVKKTQFFEGFIEHLRKVPDQQYDFQQATLKDLKNLDVNSYSIEISLPADGENGKFVRCSGTVQDKEDGVIDVSNDYQCWDDTETSTYSDSIEEVVTEWPTSEPTAVHQPVKLDNEVQTEPVTSGEQFIAVPRVVQPCIGCSSQVDPEAAGVPELATLGPKQLDRLEPTIHHSLNKVLTVERQVQVVNGVRYMLTMLIDYNSCSEIVTQDCIATKTCKISVLDKPWAKLPDGSRYRVVIANNCTEAWLFDDNNETSDADRDKPHDSHPPTPDYSGIPNTGSLDDIIQSVHTPDLQSQPEIEKALTDEDIKNIEDQIIPNSQFTHSSTEKDESLANNVNDIHAHRVSNLESQATAIPSNSINDPHKPSQAQNAISDDKKKAIDDLLNFFDYAGFNKKDENIQETKRVKRSYEKELIMFNMAENFNKMRKSIDHAKYIYTLAQSMVNYLNEIDMSVKNRILSSVVSAEEEIENSKHFFYIQARVIIPCDKDVRCDTKDKLTKICNGVIDGSYERNPQVLNTFCYKEEKKKINIGKSKIVASDDPVLLKLANTALQKIELESSEHDALRIITLHDANTQKVSGTLTKLAILLGRTNCSKSLAIEKRSKCFIDEKLGTKLCDAELLERQRLKETKITYMCTERPFEESFVKKNLDYRFSDPDVVDILQDALQYLELQSNKNNKQKIVDLKSISTRLLSGVLINIEFSVGYTVCPNDNLIDQDMCELLKNETLRNCTVKVWQRPWLEDEKQMNVTCRSNNVNDESENDLKIRKKRHLIQQQFGGLSEQDENNPRYKDLADESLQKYLQLSGATEHHSVLTIDRVRYQVVSGSLTIIDFTVLKNNADIIKCHSEIWEQPWAKKKEINATCNVPNGQLRSKRQLNVKGGHKEQNKSDPRYKELTEESLTKYLEMSGATEPHRIVSIESVTTQVVSGSLTRINFTVLKNNADVIICHSQIWEQPWANKKEINVTCRIADEQLREKRQIPGGASDQNTNDPRYRALAEESLKKYIEGSGATDPHSVISIEKVTTQVVAGSLTRIDFTVLKNNADVIKCHSQIWEQRWANKKEINVTCRIADEQLREKRQIPGGASDQNTNDPRYRALAKESLKKYIEGSGATDPHSVISIEKVTTQVVAGSLTRIDFTVLKNNADVIKCHSQIWEQRWANKKEINVTCRIADEQLREKRQIPGGASDQNTNDPRYRALAEESLKKYIEGSGATDPHSVISIEKVTTQVVAGSLTRIDFTVLKNNADVIKCHSQIWEQRWANKKEINVTCRIADEQLREKRQIPGGASDQNTNDPRYRALAEESLKKYIEGSGATDPHSVISIEKVTTQVVAGSLTRIDFTVLKNNADVIKCHSQIWEQRWANKKEINVTCRIADEQLREKRQIPGGASDQNTNDPRYRALAEESLKKYIEGSGATDPHSVISIEKVTTQVVAGSLTRIDFTVLKNNADVIKCHSQIWEQRWANKKEINVTCRIADEQLRQKRQIPGGASDQNTNDPRYRALAEESLKKYIEGSGATDPHSVISIEKVTTQVVAGSLTRIDFTVLKNNADVIKCHSQIWEQPWANKKEINVTCRIADEQLREKRQIKVGGSTEQDKSDPHYKALAEESLNKYIEGSGATEPHSVISIEKVTTQVVAGSLTRIDFTVLKNNADVIKCHSQIWEQPWASKKEINVTCRIADEQLRQKRQIPGGASDQNTNDPRYRALAEESLKKYIEGSGATDPHSVISIEKVTTQVVAGSLTRIDFTVLKNNADVIKCHSQIWEQPWANKKEINVTCRIADEQLREKRQIKVGGSTEQDKSDPHYKALAEESLNKYIEGSGATEPHSVISIEKVTTQVVAGSLTRIDFTVLKNNADVIKCHSQIWEQPWASKKEINVTCRIADEQLKEKRQIKVGGSTEQDKSDPHYKALAEESLNKYIEGSGATEPHSVISIEKVTTHVVAGSLTRIDFTVLKNNADVIKCHSQIWEQPWANKKEINVTCRIANEKFKTERPMPGAPMKQNASDPEYWTKAEKSLKKYIEESGASEPYSVVSIEKVTTHITSDVITWIDFTVLKNNAEIMKCHSKIKLIKNEIKVKCEVVKRQVEEERENRMNGGWVTQDSNDPKYKELAENSLNKFLKSSRFVQHYKVIDVKRVQTQVVSGVKTRLTFHVSPTNCIINSNGDLSATICEVRDASVKKKCNAEVLNMTYKVKCFLRGEHPFRRKREIFRKRFKISNGKNDNKEAKHQVGSFTEQNPNKNEYNILADESLRKHQLSQDSNNRLKVLEVKRVATKVVSGMIYNIDYTAVPTTCSQNILDTSLCETINDTAILFCHAEIWDKPWLKRKKIEVACSDYNVEEDVKKGSEKESEETVRSKRSTLGGVIDKNVNDELYKKLANAATEKFHKQSKPEYFHKVLKIHKVSEQVVQGFLVTLEFSISPTTCLRTSVTDGAEHCPFQRPTATLRCFAEILDRPFVALINEDITVSCRRNKNNAKQLNDSKKANSNETKVRDKRQTRTDENEIDEDAKDIYAYRALKQLNQRSDTGNLQKLITIHDVSSTYTMETYMVTMYIETAYTYCLRQNSNRDLNECDELDGSIHRICLVKVFPSADDELVVVRLFTVCDDEPDFLTSTHLHIPHLLVMSLKILESDPNEGHKLVHRGEPNVVPSLHSHIPVQISFLAATTNCSKSVKPEIDTNIQCFVDTTIPDKICHSSIYMIPLTKKIIHINVNCTLPKLVRTRRNLTPENTTESLQMMVDDSLQKLEMASLHRYKQRVIKINSFSTKLTSGRVTTIDFDVGYTNCLKYEWVDDVTACEFIEHLPRRHCVSEVWERLWLKNGRKIDVTCQDDETPLEAHVEFESADIATRLARRALRHIEAKYPHPKKQIIVRIFSLEKQVVAGIHYRMKVEVGITDCPALSAQKNCKLVNDGNPNRFCRINVWYRPWTDHPPNFRVSCDYQAGTTTETYHHVQAEQLFFNFITTYKPDYVNDHLEMTKRFDIFKDNIRIIHELNTQERGTGDYAVTRFTDLTHEEFKTKYLGLDPSLKKPNHIPMRQAKIPNSDIIPDSFDWRRLGAVTDVKDQGSCGSCWAFSVTGNIEGQWALKTGKLISLSEQELVDCDKMDSGCNGGYMDNAYRAIEELGGLETEEEYPYEGEDDKCSYNKTLAKVSISSAVNISSNETDMVKWLVHNGPISIGINANAMQFYVGGVSHPWKMLCDPKNIDHGVLIVGYGTKEYPLFNKKLPYWIVKNSWGPSWGEQGYYRVYRGDGTCGVNTMASSAVL